jgi:hypothetical protein
VKNDRLPTRSAHRREQGEQGDVLGTRRRGTTGERLAGRAKGEEGGPLATSILADSAVSTCCRVQLVPKPSKTGDAEPFARVAVYDLHRPARSRLAVSSGPEAATARIIQAPTFLTSL